ncbi:MAG: hypothetical protein ACO1NS_05295 [Daejeonella sp.]|uniref:hypothetical protein n=1 Tax=Daejeonella sp. JGW-45 TaxID=3034148 RepID=UPI0023EC6F55|nr:hypothetical protein [Daejeonella sp. JGW-45]
MNYRFETLVTVYFRHSYFSDQLFGGFIIEPSDRSLRKLLNHGLMLKPFNGGFRILFDVNFAGGSRERSDALRDEVLCECVLRLTDKGFYNYTEPMEGDITSGIFYFHNMLKDSNSLKRSLHSDSYVTSEDLLPLDSFEERYFSKPFGKLDLLLSAGLEDSYTITFKAKETYWRYILVSDDLKSLNSPAILDSLSAESFEGPETLPVRGKDALAFRSKSPISFSQKARNVFQLVDNYDAETGRYKVVMRALPSADPNHITLIDSDSPPRTLNYSEIFIH